MKGISVVSEQNSSDDVLKNYLAQTNALLANIKQWSLALGLLVADGEKTINEERHGEYQVPTLVLSDTSGKRIAEVLPFGESIIGAWGRVDVVGGYSKQEKIVYLKEGGPTLSIRIQVGEGSTADESTRKMYRGVDAEGWYWVSPSPIRRAFPITQEVFGDLLSAVTGHEFKF